MSFEDLSALAASLPLLEAEVERRKQAAEMEALAAKADAERRARYKFNRYFPDDGPLARSKYVKHAAFMAGGAHHRERLFLAANRIGKTDTAAYEVTAHLTGLYPHWWQGRRFDRPIRSWVAGATWQTTRDIPQLALMGPPDDLKTGMLPAHLIKHWTPKSGVPNGIETIWVQHASGGVSSVQTKSYDQGRRAFEGTAQDLIWLDEEPGQEIYTECLLRTMTTSGICLVTFTPLQGLTEFVVDFLETGEMCDANGDLVKAKDHFWPGSDEMLR